MRLGRRATIALALAVPLGALVSFAVTVAVIDRRVAEYRDDQLGAWG